MDPDYLFEFETKKLVKKADFTIEKRFGNVWHYTVHFRKTEEKTSTVSPNISDDKQGFAKYV